MGEWVTAIEGTETGTRVAMMLALMSAVSHAVFGSLQKGRFDPWLVRGAIDICYAAIALPLALFLVPWPTPSLWLLLGGAFLIHVGYKILMAMAYTRGAFTVVYPVVRGTGPLATVVFAGIVFGETFTGAQWAGVLVLSGGIFALALYNIVHTRIDRDVLIAALGLAVLTGCITAVYTTYDAYGMRAAANPFTFLLWFFVIDGLFMPVVAVVRYRRMIDRPDLRPLMQRGLLGAIIAFFSFGGIMLATRLDKVGEAAVLRETSVVFAAVIGWVFLKETVGPRRLLIISTIALGAVIVEFGG